MSRHVLRYSEDIQLVTGTGRKAKKAFYHKSEENLVGSSVLPLLLYLFALEPSNHHILVSHFPKTIATAMQ